MTRRGKNKKIPTIGDLHFPFADIPVPINVQPLADEEEVAIEQLRAPIDFQFRSRIQTVRTPIY